MPWRDVVNRPMNYGVGQHVCNDVSHLSSQSSGAFTTWRNMLQWYSILSIWEIFWEFHYQQTVVRVTHEQTHLTLTYDFLVSIRTLSIELESQLQYLPTNSTTILRTWPTSVLVSLIRRFLGKAFRSIEPLTSFQAADSLIFGSRWRTHLY